MLAGVPDQNARLAHGPVAHHHQFYRSRLFAHQIIKVLYHIIPPITPNHTQSPSSPLSPSLAPPPAAQPQPAPVRSAGPASASFYEQLPPASATCWPGSGSTADAVPAAPRPARPPSASPRTRTPPTTTHTRRTTPATAAGQYASPPECIPSETTAKSGQKCPGRDPGRQRSSRRWGRNAGTCRPVRVGSYR